MANQENNPLKTTITVVAIIILVLIAALAIGSILDTPYFNCDNTSASSSQSVLSSLTATLSPTGEGITSSEVKAYNNSWMEFDGVNDAVDTGFNLSILKQSGFTISVWAKGNDGIFIDGEDITRADFDFRIYAVSSGIVYCGTSNSSDGWDSIALGDINDLNYHHLIFDWNYSSNISRGFFDGNYIRNQTISGLYDIIYPDFKIGGGGGHLFGGSIDEIRIYNETLTDAQITEIYNSGRQANASLPSDNLVLWYSFDEATGTTVHDKSGNGNDGV